MVLLEGDGIIEDLYYLLWKKDSPFHQDQLFKVNLPHTIIFKNKKPIMWYFTSRQGVISRKKHLNLLPNAIYEEFMKSVSKSGIVAQYIYRVPSWMSQENDKAQTAFKTKEHIHKEQMNDEIFIRYFDAQQLGKFSLDSKNNQRMRHR